MRKKYQLLKYLFIMGLILFIYTNLYDKNEEEVHDKFYIENPEKQKFNPRPNRSIKKVNLNNSLENEYLTQMKNFFEPDENDEQFKLYLKYKKSFNQHDSKIFYKSKVILDKIDPKKIPKSNYLIVEYTPIFGKAKYCNNKIPDEMLNKISDKQLTLKLNEKKNYTKVYDLLDKCHYKNCFFSCDKNLASQADALLFHESDLKSKVRSFSENNFDGVYAKMFDFKRNPSQFWILWNDEANPVEKTMDPFKFNWTISYNSKSEVSYCAYGCTTKLDVKLNDEDFEKLVREEFEIRRKNALWFVSNCGAKARLVFAEKLAQFYPMEINGKCNDLIKNSFKDTSRILFNNNPCKRDSECEKNAFTENKFYFAFENQNCTDYITEKFWRSLDYNLIPIVLHPKKEYYQRTAPKNSFIHLEDFDYDPKRLSDYLNLVSSDAKIYSQYFEWKKDFKSLYKGNPLEQFRLCELCEKLNNQNKNYHSYYENLSDWFNSQCTR